MKYFLTEKGNLIKPTVKMFFTNTARHSVLKFLKEKGIKGATLLEIQRGAGYSTFTKKATGESKRVGELIAKEVRKMAAAGDVVRRSKSITTLSPQQKTTGSERPRLPSRRMPRITPKRPKLKR